MRTNTRAYLRTTRDMSNLADERERDAAAALSRIRSGVRSVVATDVARVSSHFWWGAVDIANYDPGALTVEQIQCMLPIAPDGAIYDPIPPLLTESRALPLPATIRNAGSLEARARLGLCLRFNDVALAQRLSRSPIFSSSAHAHYRVNASDADAAALAEKLSADPLFRAAADEVGLPLPGAAPPPSGSSSLNTLKCLALALTALRMKIERTRGRRPMMVSNPPLTDLRFHPPHAAASARPLSVGTAARARRTLGGGASELR